MDGFMKGVGVIILVAIVVFVGYQTSLYSSAVVIYLLAWLWHAVSFVGYVAWYGLSNAWAYVIRGIGLLDYAVCALPFNPPISWGILGLAVGGVMGFVLSVRGLRRSYRRLIVIVSVAALVALAGLTVLSREKWTTIDYRNVYLNRVADMEKRNNFHDALAIYSRLIELEPLNATLYGRRATCYIHLADTVCAIKDLSSAISRDSSKAGYWMDRGELLFKNRSKAESRRDFERVVILDPSNKKARARLNEMKTFSANVKRITSTTADLFRDHDRNSFLLRQLKEGQAVVFVKTWRAQGDGVKTAHQITLYPSGGAITLPQGHPLVIIANQGNDHYLVEFLYDSGIGLKTYQAPIFRSAVVKVLGESWSNVRTEDGIPGWVLSKYLD